MSKRQTLRYEKMIRALTDRVSALEVSQAPAPSGPLKPLGEWVAGQYVRPGFLDPANWGADWYVTFPKETPEAYAIRKAMAKEEACNGGHEPAQSVRVQVDPLCNRPGFLPLCNADLSGKVHYPEYVDVPYPDTTGMNGFQIADYMADILNPKSPRFIADVEASRLVYGHLEEQFAAWIQTPLGSLPLGLPDPTPKRVKLTRWQKLCAFRI